MPPPTLDAAPASLPRAIRDAVLGIGLLSAMDAAVKLATASLPVVQVTFLRFAFGAMAIAVAVAWTRPRVPTLEALRINFVRGLLVVATGLSFFTALSRLPLAEATALSFLAPSFMALFGAIFLKERVGGRALAALAIGFAGMLVIVFGQGGFGQGELPGGSASGVGLDPLGVVAGLAAAVFYALAMVLVRARARIDGVVTIVALQHLFPALVLAGPAAFVWQPLTGDLVWLFGLVGTLGVGGHLLLARAFRSAEAARIAPIDYTALVWAAALGLVLFGEVPGLATLAGAVLIVAGAVVASRR
ncbi:DMT family transporter [Salinarimonas rosea]|uniref:DMT family transporter n=1 Tax=Salinarimonas rosea TaxID=552063 RepID=UPI0003FB69CF|nr:DMT family transporter [Salinarimonas rosea]